MTDTLIAIIASLTALCAVLLGPLVAIWTAKIQARVAVLSSNRQAWINSLRDTLAEFLATARMLGLSREYNDAFEKIQRLSFLEEKIRLLLNPNEEDHRALIELVSDAKDDSIHMLGRTDNAEEIATLRSALVEKFERISAISQRILKREWIRVKKSE